MKIYLKNLAAIAVLTFFFTSCSSDEVPTSVIPKDATMVLAIDVESIVSKAQLDELDGMSSFKGFERELRSENREFFNILEDLKEDPSSAGIDLRDPIYLFTVPDGNGMYMGMSMHMLDDDDFEEFIERILDDRSTPTYDKLEEDDFISYRVRNSFNLSFDGDRILFLTHTSKRNEELYGVRDELMDLDSDETIMKNDLFEDFMDDRKDISLYLSSNIIADNRELRRAFSNLPYNLNDNTFISHLEFMDGKIELRNHIEYNEELIKYQKENKILGNDLNTDLLKYLPAKNIAAGSMALNLTNYLKAFNQANDNNDEINSMLSKLIAEFDLENLLKKMDGSMAFTLSDFEEKEVEIFSYYSEEPYKVKQTVPVFSFIAGIKDQEYIKRRINEISNGQVFEEDGLQVLALDAIKTYVSVNKSSMLVTTNRQDALNHKSGKGVSKAIKGTELATTMKDHPFYMNMNLGTSNLPSEIRNGLSRNTNGVESSWNKMMDRMEFKVESTSDTVMTLYMKNDDDNSLHQIIEFAEEAYSKIVNR